MQNYKAPHYAVFYSAMSFLPPFNSTSKITNRRLGSDNVITYGQTGYTFQKWTLRMMATDHLGQVISLYKALDAVILQEHNTDLVCLRYTSQLDSGVEFGAEHPTHKAASHPSVQVDNIGNKIT